MMEPRSVPIDHRKGYGMKKPMLFMAMLLLASTGCSRRVGTNTRMEG